jgi:hypothetical protein
MKRTLYIIALISIMGFMAVPAISAPRHNRQAGRMYERGRVENIHGLVMLVSQFTGPRGRFVGVAALVRTDRGPVRVFLGPRAYLRHNRFILEPGDRVRIHGSMVQFRDRPIMIAQRVRRHGEVLWLRNNRGMPLWAARA